MNIAALNLQPPARARRPPRRAQRQSRRRPPRVVAAGGEQRARAAARGLEGSAARPQGRRNSAPTERALLRSPARCAPPCCRSSKASSPPRPSTPANAGARLHDRDERLRRLRHAAARLLARLQRGRRCACGCRSAPGKNTPSPPTWRAVTPISCSVSTVACPPGHDATPLFDDRFVFVARKGHPLVRGKITLATYTKLAHIIVSQEPNARGVVDDVARATRAHAAINVALRVSPLPARASDRRDDALRRGAGVRSSRARWRRSHCCLQLLKMPFVAGGAMVQMMWCTSGRGHRGRTLSPGGSWRRWDGASRRRASRSRDEARRRDHDPRAPSPDAARPAS